MNDLPGWVGAIGVLFVVVAAIAGAVAVALSKATTTRQNLLESNNKTLGDRVGILEGELERERRDHKNEMEKKDLAHKVQVKEYTVQLDGLREKVQVLERVVTGREQLEHILTLLESHDARVDTFFLQMEKHDQRADGRFDELKALLAEVKK